MEQPRQVVIDANIFVSGVLSPHGPSGQVVQHWRVSRAYVTIVSRILLQEIYRALVKPKIVKRYRITEDERRRLIRQLYIRSILVSPRSHVRICRDPKDDYLIESAILGKANFLVTEDPDLFDDQRIVQALRAFNVQVLRATEFLDILQAL